MPCELGRRTTIALLAATLATSGHALECTMVSAPIPAGPAFQVLIEDQGRPVSGLRIKLQGGDNTITIATDKLGIARFQNVRPGAYYLSTEHAVSLSADEVIAVTANGPANTTIRAQWPTNPPIAIRTPSGILHWPGQLAGQQPPLRIDLMEARAARVLKSTKTTSAGAFDFDGVKPGLYFLRVTPTGPAPEFGEYLTGIIPIAVGHQAAPDKLELDLGWTSCGFAYVARHACPQQDLNVTQLNGQVLDPTGASIGRTELWLFGRDQALVEHLISDTEGRFAFTKQLNGSYEVVVSAPGFTTLRQTLRVTTPQESARPQPLRIQLGIIGTCSQATIR